MIEIQKSLLSTIDLKINSTFEHELNGPPGKEHYCLLSYLSSMFTNADIFDIGSHRGASAFALASISPTNNIYSFDIENREKLYKETPSNIEFVICNLFNEDEREKWEEKILKSPLIMIDIDPHDGILEYEFYLYLVKKDYKGIVIFDGIHYFSGMRTFWEKVDPDHRRDLTEYGHWSGSGVVDFSSQLAINQFSLLPPQEKNWTLVTAYFDLTRCSDASDEIRARDGSYYLRHSSGTLSLEYNMVIFCDPEYESRLRELRPAHLHSRTTFIPISFENMKMTRYREQIINNRKTHPYHFDPRNTASYYLLCMARYDALKKVILTNPYHSTHFAWINICMERMGPNNLIELPNALSLYRDKFSTCYIDYIPPHFVNYPAYFDYGRCSMCSGFFTGRADYMYEFCNRIEESFLHFLSKGYGHADEQLYLSVYYRYPFLFDFYYGDYQSMITNYVTTKEKQDLTIYLLIKKSYEDRNYHVCYQACRFLWKSGNRSTVLLKWYLLSSLKIGKTEDMFLSLKTISDYHISLLLEKIDLN
jgi:hypothetical protein